MNTINKKLFLIFVSSFLFTGLSIAQQSQNISLLGKYTTQSNVWGFSIQGNSAYITTQNENNYVGKGKITILDITDPSNITEAGSYIPQSVTPNFWPDFIFVTGNYAFVENNGEPMLEIYDISNVSNPYYFSGYDDWCDDMQIIGNYAYLAAGSSGLLILDISNLQNISLAGYYELPAVSYAHSLRVINNKAYMAFSEFKIINVSDVYNPALLVSYDTPGEAYGMYLKDNYAYIADGEEGLRIIDISNESTPNEIGYYTADSMFSSSFLDVIVDGNYAYVADWWLGVRIIDVSDPSTPTEVGFYKIFDTDVISVDGNIIYANGRDGFYILQNDLLTTVEENEKVPLEFLLSQNYPNPFNPSTKIKYSIPYSSKVVIKIFNILGREIETLVNEEKSVGTYEINWNASTLSSGVYLYRIQAGDFAQTKKIILLK